MESSAASVVPPDELDEVPASVVEDVDPEDVTIGSGIGAVDEDPGPSAGLVVLLDASPLSGSTAEPHAPNPSTTTTPTNRM